MFLKIGVVRITQVATGFKTYFGTVGGRPLHRPFRTHTAAGQYAADVYARWKRRHA